MFVELRARTLPHLIERTSEYRRREKEGGYIYLAGKVNIPALAKQPEIRVRDGEQRLLVVLLAKALSLE